MYEHLLVALDGSHHAEKVLDYAEALAKAFHSTITLLRATLSAETPKKTNGAAPEMTTAG